jgi:hypothetical protein
MPQIRGNTQIQPASISADRLQALFNLPTSQLQDGSTFLRSGGSVPLAANLSAGGNTITNLATPTNATDAATKGYADALVQGLDVKASVRAAVTGNFATLSGPQSLDGVACVAGDRVLLTGQTNAAQNGIWVVQAAAWTRPADYPAASTTAVTSGAFVFVEEGSLNADSGWTLTTNGVITVDTTATTWTQFSGAGQIIAGSGLTKTGNTINVGVASNGGIALAADTIAIQLAPSSGLVLGASGLSVDPAATVLVSKVATLEPQTLTGAVNGINTAFALPSAPLAGTVRVFLNGLLQRPTTDYTISGSTVTFVVAPSSTGATDWVAASYLAA